MIRAYLGQILLIALLLACIAALWYRGSALSARHDLGDAIAERDAAYQDIAHLSATLATERARATRMAEIGSKHEDDRRDAESVPAAVVAGIGDGTLKLRKQWAACETGRLSDSVASAIERDALAGLRAKDQGDLVRVGRDADDLAKACQAIVKEDRQ